MTHGIDGKECSSAMIAPALVEPDCNPDRVWLKHPIAKNFLIGQNTQNMARAANQASESRPEAGIIMDISTVLLHKLNRNQL
jgi:hypothetical protein